MSKRNVRKKCTKKNFKHNFLALLVRCKNEPYVSEFVEYYLKQGVDKIYIVDDNSNKNIYKDVLHKKVKIIESNGKSPTEMGNCKEIYKKIKNKYEWLINVDMDEYITTKKNMHNTIRDELQTTFKDCMCIKIPWVMMSCNSIRYNPQSLLKTNVYRWNHNKKHINKITDEPKFRCRYNEIEIKCIFKPRFFDDIFDHHPKSPNCDVKIVEGVRNTQQELFPFYKNLREKDIKEGYLLCYHYRTVSIEQCLDKIKYNTWYKKYTIEQLMSFDYPELKDNTLKNKIET
jgi:hypothetical protein